MPLQAQFTNPKYLLPFNPVICICIFPFVTTEGISLECSQIHTIDMHICIGPEVFGVPLAHTSLLIDTHLRQNTPDFLFREQTK